MPTKPDKPLHQMFTAVPRRYDLINHVITFGFDKWWRGKAARECLTSHPRKLLDLCCGTGDLAITISQLSGKNAELTGLDFSRPMLEIANKKAAVSDKGKNISFVYGDVASLPFPDGYFDCVGISFAFRNLTYKNPLTSRYLAEIWRVLGDGGRYVIVESSQPKSKLIRKLFHLYLRWFVARVGHWLSGNKGAYTYLAESASRFFSSEEVEEMLLEVGFREVSYHPLLFGAVGIHVAVK